MQPLTVVHRLRHGGSSTLEGGAQWILDQLVQFADVRAAHVFLWEGDRLACLATRGELPDPAVFEMWLLERLFSESEEVTVRVGSTEEVPRADVFVVQDRSYRMLRLITGSSSGSLLAGVLVLSDDASVEIAPAVLRVIAERLIGSSEMSSTATTGRDSS